MIALIKSEILITTGMVWQVSSDKWKAPFERVDCMYVLSLLFGPCVKVHEDRNRTTNFFYINININTEYIISHGISTTYFIGSERTFL